MVKRILVARTADVVNTNAQAKNAQSILARWQSSEYRPCILAYGEADPAVAGNPRVELLQLRRGRVWRIDLLLKYLGRFDAIFYPGVHHRVDWLALKARALLGRHIPVIATLEGILGSTEHDKIELFLEARIGHRIYCQKIPEPELRRHESILRNSDHIIAISPFLARVATIRYGQKVSTLPLGVDTKKFNRLAWKMPARTRVVAAGNVRPHKRPDIFVGLARRFPQADFVWFGEGDRQLLQHLRGTGLPNLSFVGSVQPDVLAEEFARSDILVMPSLAEGVPKVTQEAAASGLAQVIFGYYEAPSVTNGENGFVVWSDEELVSKLEQLITNPPLVEQMGRIGMKMAAQWSWDVIAPQWERRIIEVLESQVVIP